MVSPTTPSQAFEKQVKRIHDLIEAKGAEVTWDDHIPDPDNPSQSRQIDITVKHGSKLTIIECRLHQRPQDVNWIETLMGRRESLNADEAIAVSASGFTKGAIEKAHRRGVVARSLSRLSDAEVQAWGQVFSYRVILYEFRDVEISVFLPQGAKLSADSALRDADGRPIDWAEFLREITKRPRPKRIKLLRQWMYFRGRLPTGITVDDVPATDAFAKGRFRTFERRGTLSSVSIYGDAGEAKHHALVAGFGESETQILKGPSSASLVLDLSSFEVPENCLAAVSMFSTAEGMAVEHIEIMGWRNFLQCKVPINLVHMEQS